MVNPYVSLYIDIYNMQVSLVFALWVFFVVQLNLSLVKLHTVCYKFT